MSASLALLRVLADCQPHTANEMADLTGLKIELVMKGMSILRKAKQMRSQDLPYTITEAGKEALAEREAMAVRVADRKKNRIAKKVDAIERAKRDRSNIARQKRRQEEREALLADENMSFTHKIVEAPVAADSIVSAAMQSRPALQAVWGVLA